jgi:hypothetical protein
VLRLLRTDLTQREIADQLYVSFNTVKTHTKSIFRKLDVATRKRRRCAWPRSWFALTEDYGLSPSGIDLLSASKITSRPNSNSLPKS